MEAQQGDTVKVHYRGRLNDGTLFDDSFARNEPLVFTLGNNNLIPGFANAVLGMQPGEEKKVELTPQESYGPHRPELVMKVNRSEFPRDVTPVIGQQLRVSQDDAAFTVVTVTAVDGDTITLDGNHPLAGQGLIFEIRLIEITPRCSCCG